MREPAGRPASGGTSNGADRSLREREGAFGNAIIAEVHYSPVTNHYHRVWPQVYYGQYHGTGHTECP